MGPSVLIFSEDPGEPRLLSSLLEGSHKLLVAASRAALLDSARAPDVDCIVAYLEDPGNGGTELIQAVRSRSAFQIPVIVVVEATDITTAVSLMRAGAVDLLEKPLTSRKLLEAIRKAVDHTRGDHGLRELEMFRALSAREQDVAALLGAGQTGKQTAELLGISPRTVDIYRSQILKKLAVPNVAALASFLGRARTGEDAAIEVSDSTQGEKE